MIQEDYLMKVAFGEKWINSLKSSGIGKKILGNSFVTKGLEMKKNFFAKPIVKKIGKIANPVFTIGAAPLAFLSSPRKGKIFG